MVWETARLGELAQINYGYTAKASFETDGPKFLRITDIQNGVVNWSTVPSCELSDQDFIKHKLETNDIVFARTGATTGKSFLIKEIENSVAASYLIRLRLTSSEILPEFVSIFFQTSMYWDLVEAGSSGSAQGGFNASKLSNLEINFPPIPEQKRIVSILDTVFADLEQTRAKTEQNLKNARELFDSYLQKVFSQKGEGWKQHKLSELCKLISGQHIDAKDYNNDKIGIGYLTGPSDFGVFNPIVTKWSEYPKRTAIQGDILITVKGSGVGKINMMSADELAISRQLMAVRPMYSVGELIYWFLSMQFDYFQSLANGAAIPGISRHDVLDLELSLPALNDQTSVLKKIKKFNTQTLALEKIYTDKIRAIDELKKSILQKAFSGELTKTVE